MSEFLHSSEADRLGISNVPLPEHEYNLRMVTAPLCQKIRDKVGAPVTICSGYRNPEVNKAVGGVPDSAHALGLATDISVEGMAAYDLATGIAADADLMAGIDQLILETGRAVVHVGAGPGNRRQTLTQKGAAGTAFLPGIVA